MSTQPGSLEMVARQWDYFRTLFRRTWRGSIVSYTLLPVFFLLAMGLGLGGYVDDGGSSTIGISYLAFIAPGMLATNAMTMAVGESTYPIWVSFKWSRSTPPGSPRRCASSTSLTASSRSCSYAWC